MSKPTPPAPPAPPPPKPKPRPPRPGPAPIPEPDDQLYDAPPVSPDQALELIEHCVDLIRRDMHRARTTSTGLAAAAAHQVAQRRSPLSDV